MTDPEPTDDELDDELAGALAVYAGLFSFDRDPGRLRPLAASVRALAGDLDTIHAFDVGSAEMAVTPLLPDD